MGLFIELAVAGLGLLGAWYCIQDKRDRRRAARPYDWSVDGECGPQRSHVRVIDKAS